MPTAEERGNPTRRNNGTLTFLRAFLAQPHRIGAALPSSPRLARALMDPFIGRTGPARVLEVGAGTGAITRHIGHEMGLDDELTICEPQPALAAHIELQILTEPQFADAVREGRVQMTQCPIQNLQATSQFDYIIAGLPFTAFAEDEVWNVLQVVRRALSPRGVFSYFEYLALRRLRMLTSIGTQRERIGRVSSILDQHIDRFQIGRQTVLGNVPPAFARHWRFD